MTTDRTPPSTVGRNRPDPEPAAPDGVGITEGTDGRVVVQIRGDLDALTSPAVRSTLLEVIARRPPTVVVDMTAVGFLDSAGISALVVAHNRGLDAGVAIELAAVPAGCRRVLEITSLADVFTIVD